MDNKVVQWVTRSTPLESKGTWKKFVQERKGFDEGGLATPKRGLVDEPGSYAGSNLSAKNLKKYNKIAKILYDRGEISSPNYLDLEYLSKDHNKVMARKDREIIKKKDGTLDFKSGREKPLRLDQQAKLKKRFPEADFSKGKYGFAVDSAKEQYAKRYFKQGYKETLKEGLTTKQIADIKERFPEIPKKDWNFLTKDNPKGFKYGLAGTGEGGKYATMGKRISGYLEGKTWFDRFAPGLNANSQNYLLTSFERIAEHEDKLKPSERTYKRIKNKDGKIIGFQDNTPTGKGKKYYMVNSKIKGGTPITKHPGYAKGAEITKYVEATKGMKIGGAKFNDLISESMKTKPGGFGVTPWERHHIYGTAKTGFGGMPGEIMLLSRDQNRAVEGVRKAYYRGADSRYGKPISFEQADKRLKKIGAALDLDGRLAGTVVSPQQTIQSAGKAAGINSKKLANLLAKAGFRCGAKDGISCDRPEAYFKDIEESTKAAKEGKPGAIRKFNNAGNIARKSKGVLKVTGLGILAEAGFEGGFVLNDILSGVPVKEAFQKSLFQYVPFIGLGGTKDAEASEMKRIVGKDPRSQQYAADLQSSNELNKLYKDYVTKRDDVFGAYDRDVVLDAENKLYSFIKNLDPKTYTRLKFGSPEYEAFEAKQEVEDVNKLKRAMDLDPFKQKRMEIKRSQEPSLEDDYMNLRRAKEIGAIPFEDKMSEIASYGGVANMAGGGIAGVRRPHAIPPKSGPMPQGGGLSSQFNRVRKVLGV